MGGFHCTLYSAVGAGRAPRLRVPWLVLGPAMGLSRISRAELRTRRKGENPCSKGVKTKCAGQFARNSQLL